MKKTFLIAFLYILSTHLILAQAHYFPWNDDPANVVSNTPKVLAVSGSDLALNNNPEQVFYVGNDQKVRSYYKINSTDYDHFALNPTAPLAYDKTGLVFDNTGNLYYTNTANQISTLKPPVGSGSWIHNSINTFIPSSAPFTPTANDSKLVIGTNNGNFTLFYVANNNKIHYIELTPSGWTTDILAPALPDVRGNSPLERDSDGNIYFIDINNKLRNLYLDNGIWWSDIISTNFTDVGFLSDLALDKDDKIYYVGIDSKVHNLYQSNGIWQGGVLDLNSKELASSNQFTVNNGSIFFLAIDDKTYSTFYNGCNWETTRLTSLNNSTQLNSAGWCSDYNDGTYTNSYYLDGQGYLRILSPKFDYSKDYVFVKGKNLWYEKKPFEVKGSNYELSINKDTRAGSSTFGKYYISPYARRCDKILKCSTDPITAEDLVNADFDYMKNVMGLNTIRVTGVGMDLFEKNTSDPNLYSYVVEDNWTNTSYNCYDKLVPTYRCVSKHVKVMVDQNFIDNVYIPSVERLLELAEDNGLKVILLTGINHANKPSQFSKYNDFLEDIAEAFQGNSTLMAIDVFNEPSNHWDGSQMTKENVCTTTQNMYNAIRNVNDNLMVTIGLYPTDVWVWDPNIISADFINYHIYVCDNELGATDCINNLDQLYKDYYYINEYTKKAWIVGETSFSYSPSAGTWPDLGVQGTNADQKLFMQKSLEYSVLAKSSGLLWWSYHDVYGVTANTSGAYLGLLYNKEDCRGPDVDKEKDMVNVLRDFNSYCDNSSFNEPTNYYSDPSLPLQISGTIEDASGQGIPNAFILVRDGNSIVKDRVYADENGYFEYRSNINITSFDYIDYSAPGYEVKDRYQPFLTTYTLDPIACNLAVLRKKSTIVDTDIDSKTVSIDIYPNPANQLLNFDIGGDIEGRSTVKLFNNVGKLMNEFSISANQSSIDVSQYPNGIYYVHIQNGGEVVRKKLLIVK